MNKCNKPECIFWHNNIDIDGTRYSSCSLNSNVSKVKCGPETLKFEPHNKCGLCPFLERFGYNSGFGGQDEWTETGRRCRVGRMNICPGGNIIEVKMTNRGYQIDNEERGGWIE